MGWWTRQVVPRILNKACDTGAEREIRARLCAGLPGGEVLELGFGSGLNLPHLPGTVTTLYAVDPSDVGYALAAERLAATHVDVRRLALDELPDASVDAVLTTWTMCTIPDTVGALRDARRVLRPGGTLHFAEHGLAPDDGVARWQRRLDPAQRRMAGGCHLSRSPDRMLADAGFEVTALERYYSTGAPKVFTSMYEGSRRPLRRGRTPTRACGCLR